MPAWKRTALGVLIILEGLIAAAISSRVCRGRHFHVALQVHKSVLSHGEVYHLIVIQ